MRRLHYLHHGLYHAADAEYVSLGIGILTSWASSVMACAIFAGCDLSLFLVAFLAGTLSPHRWRWRTQVMLSMAHRPAAHSVILRLWLSSTRHGHHAFAANLRQQMAGIITTAKYATPRQ